MIDRASTTPLRSRAYREASHLHSPGNAGAEWRNCRLHGQQDGALRVKCNLVFRYSDLHNHVHAGGQSSNHRNLQRDVHTGAIAIGDDHGKDQRT